MDLDKCLFTTSHYSSYSCQLLLLESWPLTFSACWWHYLAGVGNTHFVGKTDSVLINGVILFVQPKVLIIFRSSPPGMSSLVTFFRGMHLPYDTCDCQWMPENFLRQSFPFLSAHGIWTCQALSEKQFRQISRLCIVVDSSNSPPHHYPQELQLEWLYCLEGYELVSLKTSSVLALWLQGLFWGVLVVCCFLRLSTKHSIKFFDTLGKA